MGGPEDFCGSWAVETPTDPRSKTPSSNKRGNITATLYTMRDMFWFKKGP